MFPLSRKSPLDKNTKQIQKISRERLTTISNLEYLNIYLHPPLHELLLRAEAVLRVRVPLDATITDLLDQLLPDSFAQDAVDWLVGLNKGDDGEGLEEGEVEIGVRAGV